MSIPARWEGCEHVVECVACHGKGRTSGWLATQCHLCQGRGVQWNRLTIPENMQIRGYSVFCGICYHENVPMTDSQVCANIWHLDGAKAEWKPSPLHLLKGVPVCTLD